MNVKELSPAQHHQMPKQVWQSEDGLIFDTESECVKYEKLQAYLNELTDCSYNRDDRAERLGLPEGFVWCIDSGFDAQDIWKYRESIIKLAKILES